MELLVAHIAQSAEHILGKDEVTGSIPVVSSFRSPRYHICGVGGFVLPVAGCSVDIGGRGIPVFAKAPLR